MQELPEGESEGLSTEREGKGTPSDIPQQARSSRGNEEGYGTLQAESSRTDRGLSEEPSQQGCPKAICSDGQVQGSTTAVSSFGKRQGLSKKAVSSSQGDRGDSAENEGVEQQLQQDSSGQGAKPTLLDKREGCNQETTEGQELQKQPIRISSSAAIQREETSTTEGCSQHANGGGVGRDKSNLQESLLLLPSEETADERPSDSSFSRRQQHEGQHNSSLSELQFEEGQPAGFPSLTSHHLRDVWSFPTQPFGLEMCAACKRIYEPRQFARLAQADGRRVCRCGASDFLSHFATFPEALVERCILAGTPTAVCSKCGAPWARVVEATPEYRRLLDTTSERWFQRQTDPFKDGRKQDNTYSGISADYKTLGFRPTCTCSAPSQPALVLDPFVGSGTTCIVAKRLGRRSVGIDLSTEYLALAAYRLERTQSALGALGR